jgi:transcription initiation factor TFIID subunit 8
VCASSPSVSLRRVLLIRQTAVIGEIYRRAQDFGNLANRAAPTVIDAYEAVAEFGLEPKEFKLVTKKRKRGAFAFPRSLELKLKRTAAHRRLAKHTPKFELVEPTPMEPTPRLLSSDQEEAIPAIPATLRALPNAMPPLPPKHTYFRTPVRNFLRPTVCSLTPAEAVAAAETKRSHARQ